MKNAFAIGSMEFGEMYPDFKPVVNGIYIEITSGKQENIKGQLHV